MSCEHCDHCKEQRSREEYESRLHPIGTRLVVTTVRELGVVTYWRAGTEYAGADGKPTIHVVYCEDADHCKRPTMNAEPDQADCIGHWVQTDALALAPEKKKTRKGARR